MGIETEKAPMPLKIVKRDLTEAKFERAKIYEAILKAGKASGEFEADIADKMTRQVIDVLSFRFTNLTVPTVEQVQDIVEHCLAVNRYFATAKA